MKRKGVLYLGIADTIKQDIQNNIYPVGTMLPTENDFEKKFSVSKITIRKAIEVLALQGYVEKKSGKGTTVISNRLFNKLSKGESFSTVLEKQGLVIEKEIIAVEKINVAEQAELAQYFQPVATKVTRMYLADGQPFIMFTHYLPGNVLSSIKKNLATTSLYNILADNRYLVDRFEDQFCVAKLTPVEQVSLKTTETHAMKRIRKSFNKDGQVIEVASSLYNTSIHPYEIHFEI